MFYLLFLSSFKAYPAFGFIKDGRLYLKALKTIIDLSDPI